MGCWGIGGRTPGNTSYGDADDTRSIETVQTAISSGIRFFDVAPTYGHGHAETVLGQAIADHRDTVFVATKVGRERFDQPEDFSSGEMRRSLEISLGRMGIDYVDLIQLHDPSPDALAGSAILDDLFALREAGLAHHVGVSCKAPEDGLPLVGSGVDFLQVNFNLMDQRALDLGLFANAAGKLALIARTPLCSRCLTGAIPENPQFADGDHRNNWSPGQITRWVEGAREFAEITSTEHHIPILDIALRYCVSFSAVTVVLPGMMHPSEVLANRSALAAGPLPDAVVSQISQFYQKTEFFLRG